MGEWEELTLGEVYDFASGLSKPRSEFGSGYPFLSFKDVFYNHFVPENLSSLVRSDDRERQACSIKRGDVFLTRTSETMDELGMSSVALRDIPNGTFNGFTKRLRPRKYDQVAPEYAAYYFRSPLFRSSVTAMATMSTRASLNNEMLDRLRILLPPRKEQEAIGYTLKSLDDKIELNRRTNETLEAMARALFKDWFVDFGPTRAKMEGRDPYLAPDLWALFPDRLDEDGKPAGWHERPLGSLGEVAIGGLWGNDDPDGADCIPYSCLRGVDLQHLRESGEALKAPLRYAKSTAVEKRMLSTTDVLIASSGAGPCGRPLWIGIDGFFSNHSVTIYSNFVKKITCNSPADACFLDRYLHEMRLTGEIQKFISGTSVPNLDDKGLLETERFVFAGPSILMAFYDFCMALQQNLYSGENRALAKTRDLLLPKLMSGEIRLRDAEKIAGEAL